MIELVHLAVERPHDAQGEQAAAEGDEPPQHRPRETFAGETCRSGIDAVGGDDTRARGRRADVASIAAASQLDPRVRDEHGREQRGLHERARDLDRLEDHESLRALEHREEGARREVEEQLRGDRART